MEKTYFLYENGQVSQPYTLDDLRQKNLTGDTMICEKFGAWKTVREIPELEELWEWSPPAPPPPDWSLPPSDVLSRPEVMGQYASDNSSANTESIVVTRRPLIPASFGVAVLCFFFVFCDLKCGEQHIASVTGIQFITGIEMEGMDFGDYAQTNSKQAPSKILAMFTLFMALIGCAAYLLSKQTESAAGIILGIFGAISLLALQISVKNQFEKEGDGVLIAEFQPAYWIALLAMVAAAIISSTLPSRSAKGNLSPPAEPPLPEQKVKAPPEKQESDESPPIVQLVEEVIPKQRRGSGIKLAVGLSSVLILIAAGYFFLVKPGLDSKNAMMGDTLLSEGVMSSPAGWKSPAGKAIEMAENQFIIDTYMGTIDNKEFKLFIEKVDGDNVEGYNVTGTNRRPVKGRIVNKWIKDAGAGGYYTIFKLKLNEPGDHKWDGEFSIDLWISEKSRHGEGEWKSYSGNLVRAIKIKEKKKNSPPAEVAPETTHSTGYVEGLDVLTTGHFCKTGVFHILRY